MADRPWVILLSGVSGSGKTTISAVLQRQLSSPERPFLHVEADRLLPHLPDRWSPGSPDRVGRLSTAMRDACLAFAASGFDLIVDGILPYGDQSAVAETVQLFGRFRLCYVGVHCDLSVLEKREARRTDREAGWARRQYADLHADQKYDVEIDTSHAPPEKNARQIAAYVVDRDASLRRGART